MRDLATVSRLAQEAMDRIRQREDAMQTDAPAPQPAPVEHIFTPAELQYIDAEGDPDAERVEQGEPDDGAYLPPPSGVRTFTACTAPSQPEFTEEERLEACREAAVLSTSWMFPRLWKTVALKNRILRENRDLREQLSVACGFHGEDLVPALVKRNRELEQWKAEHLAVEATWDEQAVGEALGLQLGQPIRSAILPGILRLQKEVQYLCEGVIETKHLAEAAEQQLAQMQARLDILEPKESAAAGGIAYESA